MSDQFTSGDKPEGASLPPESTVATASWWEDFMDIFYKPSSVFARRASSGFGIPMLVVTLLIGLIFIANSGVMQPIMDAEFTRGITAAIKKHPEITAAQMAQSRLIFEKFAAVGVFITTPIMLACIGVVLWLAGKLVDAKQTVGAAVMVASYAYLPRVLEGIVNGVQAQLMDPARLNGRYALSLGVGRFFDPETASPILLAIVGRLDLFTIWITVLLVIGLSVTGKIPRKNAAIIGVLIWIVGGLQGLLGAM